jgi:hypothetical protein
MVMVMVFSLAHVARDAVRRAGGHRLPADWPTSSPRLQRERLAQGNLKRRSSQAAVVASAVASALTRRGQARASAWVL